jgi:hypothetical protein
METASHSINALFEQLGLDGGDDAIDAFISRHKPLPAQVLLQDAEFWSPAQAAFLKQALEEDADWAEIVDQLDVMLR